MSDPAAIYLDAFRARCAAAPRHPAAPIDEPGIHARLPADGDPLGRAVVIDDAANATLGRLVNDWSDGMITVLHRAPRARALVADHDGWAGDEATAMICASLDAIPERPLPDALRLAPVRRTDTDPLGGVALIDAARAAVAAFGDPPERAESLAAFLRGMPANVRLLVAVDDDGAVRATSGYGVYGDFASVIFVNTDRAWRRRGVGGAMTALALRSAREHGARRASLDASGLGLPIYRRLGFTSVGAVTRFRRGDAF